MADRPASRRRSPRRTHIGGQRVCTCCGRPFAENRYEGVPAPGYCNGFRPECRDCYNAYMRAYMRTYMRARRQRFKLPVA